MLLTFTVLPRFLWSSTSTSGFDSLSGEISGLKLQNLQLLRSSPPGFDACFGLAGASLYASTGANSIGWAAPAPRAGACTGYGRAPEPGADGQPPEATLPGQLRVCCQ